MAVRNEARILTSIWGDPDFLTLTADAQWTYLMLVSQPNLGFAGIIATTTGRWSKYTTGMTVTRVRRAVRELDNQGFLVVDDSTEETLVRAFIRIDNVWRQPKLLRIAVREAAAAASPRIREAIALELARCEPSLLSDKPTWEKTESGERAETGPSVRQQVETLISEAIPELVPQPLSLGASGGASAGAYADPSARAYAGPP